MHYLALFLLGAVIFEVGYCKPAKHHSKHLKHTPLEDYIEKSKTHHLKHNLENHVENLKDSEVSKVLPVKHHSKHLKNGPDSHLEDYIEKSKTHHLNQDLKNHVENVEDSEVSKILGGEVATEGQFPFIVSLESDGNHFCGGSAISAHWVLTAAHCYDEDMDLTETKVRAGSLKSEEDGKLFDVEDFIIHPQYTEGASFANDIALIRVSQSLDTVSNLKYIDLPEPDADVDPGVVVTAAGWGLTTAEGWGPVSKDLLYVNLNTIENEGCNASPAFKRLRRYYSEDLKVTKDMMCTATETKDTCKGDSGGPLVIQDEGKTVQVGVVSWGEGGGELESPGVYTRVSHYVEWILQHTELSP